MTTSRVQEVADEFGVCLRTLLRWRKQWTATGSLAPGLSGIRGLTNEDQRLLLTHYRMYPTTTNEELAALLDFKIHPRSVNEYLLRNGIRRGPGRHMNPSNEEPIEPLSLLDRFLAMYRLYHTMHSRDKTPQRAKKMMEIWIHLVTEQPDVWPILIDRLDDIHYTR